MQNVKVEMQGTTLVLTIDTTVDMGLSKSGKTRLVASTQGNKKLEVGGREVFIGLNVYTK